MGECRPGRQFCRDGRYGSCQGGIEPVAELCDGLDNDCDEAVDGIGASPAGRRPWAAAPTGGSAASKGDMKCVTQSRRADRHLRRHRRRLRQPHRRRPPAGALSARRAGICASGRNVCQAGVEVCVRDVVPAAEAFDGLDNDCDGRCRTAQAPPPGHRHGRREHRRSRRSACRATRPRPGRWWWIPASACRPPRRWWPGSSCRPRTRPPPSHWRALRLRRHRSLGPGPPRQRPGHSPIRTTSRVRPLPRGAGPQLARAAAVVRHLRPAGHRGLHRRPRPTAFTFHVGNAGEDAVGFMVLVDRQPSPGDLPPLTDRAGGPLGRRPSAER
ncbi:MAG: MopE-related protein [bacterium]